MRSDQQIVDETNALARHLLRRLIGTGYEVSEELKFYEPHDNPRIAAAWDHAVEIMEITTKTDAREALANVLADEEPLLRTYGVRMWATFRATAETSVEATSFAAALEAAKDLNIRDFSVSIEGCEGDETIHLHGPADDDPSTDDEWSGDGVEIDAREKGEPFSWDAVHLVQALAKLDISSRATARGTLLQFVERAKAACKEA